MVIADRYADSTLAYQGAGRGVSDIETLRTIQSCATSGLQPDLTFILDLTPRGCSPTENGSRRRTGPDGRGKPRLSTTVSGTCYLELADQEPNRIVHVLDARQPEAELATHIAEILASSS